MIFPLHKFPFSNFHELNLDWILNKLKEFDETLKQFRSELDEFRQTLETATQQIETNKNDIAELNQKYTSLEARVKALEDITGGVVYSVNNLESTATADDFTELTTPEIETGTFSPVDL